MSGILLVCQIQPAFSALARICLSSPWCLVVSEFFYLVFHSISSSTLFDICFPIENSSNQAWKPEVKMSQIADKGTQVLL